MNEVVRWPFLVAHFDAIHMLPVSATSSQCVMLMKVSEHSSKHRDGPSSGSFSMTTHRNTRYLDGQPHSSYWRIDMDAVNEAGQHFLAQSLMAKSVRVTFVMVLTTFPSK